MPGTPVVFNFVARDKDFSGGLRRMEQRTASFGSTVGKVALRLTGPAALGALTIGVFKLGESFDSAYDTIRVTTGKTGKTLSGLQKDFKAVVQDVPTDFESAATAVGKLNQRTGQTGRGLQRLAAQELELSRITKTDLGSNIAASTRLFRDWSIPTAKQATTLDEMFRAAQATGIGVTDLMEKVVQFGSPLRQLGFNLDQTTALFGEFERAGVVTETVLPGLKMALKSYALAHKDPQKALIETIKRIKESSTTAQANTIAFKTFGARAGPDLAAAIREGHFDLDLLIKTISGGKDTIRGAAADTADFAEKWKVFSNRMKVLVEPAVSGLFTAISTLADKLAPTARKVGNFAMGLRDSLVGALDRTGAATIASSWWAALSSGLTNAVKTHDWSAFGRQLADAAQRIVGTGGAFIQQAFAKVDWKALGSFLGSKLVAIIQGVGNISAALGRLFAGINWEGIGKQAGLAAFPFAVGFVNNLLNGIVDQFRRNFWGSILAVLSIIPIGRFARIFADIPFLRLIAAPIAKAGELIEKPVFALVRGIARFFGEAIEMAFPGIGERIGKWAVRWIIGISSKFNQMKAAGARFIVGLVDGIKGEAGLVIRNIADTIGFLTRPFRVAGRWLIGRGGELIGGLVRGIASKLGAVGEWIGRTRSALTAPFAKAGGWLFNAGRNLLSGIAAGIRAGLKGIGTVLREVKNAIVGGIKRLFGIHSPSAVMAGLGSHMIGGLVRGLIGNAGSLRAIIKTIGLNAMNWFGALFSGIGKPGGPVYASIQELGRAMVTARWGPGQWPAFNALEMGEAGWNPRARNPSSGAYGLPQALPPSKLPAAAFSSNLMEAAAAQLQWMIGYITDRYGTPASAYGAWLSRTPHWYAAGLEPTVFSRPTLIGVGERGPEIVSVTRGGGGIDYDRLADAMVGAMQRAGIGQVVLNGRRMDQQLSSAHVLNAGRR